MAIFGNFHDYDVTAEGSYDYEFGGAYDIAMETYQDEVAVIEAIHAYDIAETVGLREGMESGELEYVLEGKMGDIWTKIKEFVKKFWAKVKAFFGNMIISIKNLFMSNKKFAEAYANKINPNYEKKDVTGYENYFKDVSTLYRVPRAENLKKDTDHMLAFVDAALQEVEKKDISDKENSAYSISASLTMAFELDNDNRADSVRYKALYGKEGKLTSEEFAEKLDEYIKGKEVTKTINASMVKSFFSSLLKVDDTVKRLESAQKAYDAASKSVVDKLNKIEANSRKIKSKGTYMKSDEQIAADHKRKYSGISSAIGSGTHNGISDEAIEFERSIYEERNKKVSESIKAAKTIASIYTAVGNQVNTIYGREISSVKSIVAFQRKFCVAAVKK